MAMTYQKTPDHWVVHTGHESGPDTKVAFPAQELTRTH